MQIFFILYKSSVPGNIGAAARALKTMGFSRLRLIDPCSHLSEEAKMLAHASHEILENAEIFESFEESIKDLDFLIGTTAKKRSVKTDYIEASRLSELLESKGSQLKNAGIVFGTEESGLPNEILKKCDIASTIPMKTQYPSLNLGQAVMLYAYELSMSRTHREVKTKKENSSYRELKRKVPELLKNIGIPDEMPLHSRILERISHMNAADINMLHSVSSRLEKLLAKLRGTDNKLKD